MKIIGNTVGMGLPKPNLMQADATKGDYIYGKEEFLANLTTENITAALGYTPAREEEVSQLAGEIDNAKAFMVEYGVTEYGEIEAAYNAGRMLYCKRGDDLYPFSHFKTTAAGNVTTYYAVFCGNAGLSLSELSCSDASVWSVAVKQLISTGVLDQAVNSSASNASAPSTKAVYNATKDAVKTTRQTLTDEQKAQARENIGAVDAESVIQVFEEKVTRPATAEVGQVIAVKAVDANGKPTEWEAVDMAGGGVQSDWNQTDETAADFIKNKPFGNEVAEIMPETEVVGKEADGLYIVDLDASLFTGEEAEVSITFDGTEYICTAFDSSGGRGYGNALCVGGEDTGEPFMLLVIVEFGLAMLALLDANPHTVRISAPAVKQLDSKYIPACATLYTNGSDNYLYTDASATVKATHAYLKAATQKGALNILGLHGNGVHPPITVSIDGFIFPYSRVVIVGQYSGNTGKPDTYKILYTAEYTPET